MNILTPKHILIVDDSPDNRLLLKVLLESRGYTTECTSNGEEALELLNTSNNLPQAVLLDMRMPVMDGMTFRRIQKADPRLKEIPVIVLSGDEPTDSLRNETESDVMQKPFNVGLLMETIKRTSQLH